jgi:hypothetical protein
MAPDPQQNGSVDKKGNPPPSSDSKKSKKDEKKDEDLVSDEGFLISSVGFSIVCFLVGLPCL